MKVLTKRVQKDRSLTIHVTSAEDRYLRTRKRETGLPISDIIMQEYLSDTAASFFDERKRNARNGHPIASDAPPIQ